jgi:hypothetical protein
MAQTISHQNINILLPKLPLPPHKRKLLHPLMPPLPLLPMLRKAFTLRLRNPRKHAHLQDIHVREDFRLAHDGSVILPSASPPFFNLEQKKDSEGEREMGGKIGDRVGYVRPTVPTKQPLHTLPAARRPVIIDFQLPIRIFIGDFIFLDC